MRGVSLLNDVYGGAVVPRPSPSKLISRYVPREATRHLALFFSGLRADFNLHTKPRRSNFAARESAWRRRRLRRCRGQNVRVRLGNSKLESRSCENKSSARLYTGLQFAARNGKVSVSALAEFKTRRAR